MTPDPVGTRSLKNRHGTPDESSPYFLPGAFQVITATFSANPKIELRFKTGKGLGWDQQDHRLFESMERFFCQNYLGNLVANWIPFLDGVEAKLKRGAKVSDAGCGFGVSPSSWRRPIPHPPSSASITIALYPNGTQKGQGCRPEERDFGSSEVHRLSRQGIRLRRRQPANSSKR